MNNFTFNENENGAFYSFRKWGKKAIFASFLAMGFLGCKKSDMPVAEDSATQKKTFMDAPNGLNSNFQKPITIGYYPSWGEGWLGADGKSTFTSLPSSVTHVFFAFAKPNLRYVKNSMDISTEKTGLECYAGNGEMLKRAISILKQKGVQVILSIGGETYWNNKESFTNINYQQIKDLVDDMGFVGIDWDFEPSGGFSEIGNAENVAYLTKFITESRRVMPKSAGYIIATAPAGVGALGGVNNNDSSSPYAFEKRNALTGETDAYLYNSTAPNKAISLYGFSSTGSMIPVMKAVGDQLDIIAYQAYNTGAASDRKLMYDAYAYYANTYGFKLAHGVHVPNEPWGPYYEYTPQGVADLAKYIYDGGREKRAGKSDGVMVWQLNAVSAKGTNYTGVTYLNVAHRILNGESTSSALSSAFDYQNVSNNNNTTTPPVVTETKTNNPPEIPTTKPTETVVPPVVVTPPVVTPATKTSEPVLTPEKPVDNSANAAGGCGVAGYNSANTYSAAGTKVYYNGKIYKNKWYVNPGQVPNDEEQWGPWEFVEYCNADGTKTAPPTTTQPSNEHCGVAAYNTTKAYPSAGTQVYYNGKIYKNKWYVNPGQVPNDAEQWGPWEFVKNCN